VYIKRLTVALPREGFAGSVGPDPRVNPVFMFGTFDQAEEISAASILALNEAIVGIREDGEPVSDFPHHHAEVAADGSSGAFMFGVHPEQPPSALLGELSMFLRAADLD
jgi:hypothetical protein